MKTNPWKKWGMVLVVVAVAAGLGVGCDDDDDSDSDGGGTPGATHVNVDGNWSGTRSSEAGSAQIQIHFDQNGGVLTGSYQDTSGYAGNVAGTIDGDDIEFVLTLVGESDGDTWTFQGTANAAGTELNGRMSSHAGTDDVVASR